MSWSMGTQVLNAQRSINAGDVTQAGWIVMPSTILAYMQRVDAEMQNVDSDITRSSVSAGFKAQWARFYGSWKTFFADHQSWVSRGWGSVYDETEKFESQLHTWHAAFTAAGGKSTGAAPPNPFEQGPLGANLSRILTVVGVVGALFAAGYLLRSLPFGRGSS